MKSADGVKRPAKGRVGTAKASGVEDGCPKLPACLETRIRKWTREDTDDFYDAMIETAAVCAAAAESVLRQRNKNGRTFFEPAR